MRILKGYSTKNDGSMYLSAEGFDPENISNRDRFFHGIGCDGMRVVAAGLVHGTVVSEVTSDSPPFIPETDGLVTRTPGIILSLTGADCFPLYFEDPVSGIMGLSHAGWRGALGGIVAETIGVMEVLGSERADIRLHIGPGIRAGHFVIGHDILSRFASFPDEIRRESVNGGIRISVALMGIIRRQAFSAGIAEGYVSESPECTYCLPERYYSYRRDRPDTLQTQVAYIGIKE